MTDLQQKTAGIAITSLVLGIVGLLTVWLCGLGVLFAVPAVICGHIGYSKIKKSGGALAGDGLALAGLITGYIAIGLLVTIIPLQMAIAIPSFVKARNKSIENACLNNLRMLDAAKDQYALDHTNELATSVAQLVGPNTYLKVSPVCRSGGVYKLPTSLTGTPSCSVHGTLKP